MKIKIPEDMSNYIEMLTYEVNCHQDLLAFMAERGMDKALTQEYYKKYQDYYIELSLSKTALEQYIKSHVKGPVYSWILDFDNSEVSYND